MLENINLMLNSCDFRKLFETVNLVSNMSNMFRKLNPQLYSVQQAQCIATLKCKDKVEIAQNSIFFCVGMPECVILFLQHNDLFSIGTYEKHRHCFRRAISMLVHLLDNPLIVLKNVPILSQYILENVIKNIFVLNLVSVGLLFSYEPPFEEHEGKRARRYHLNCARSYKHMLDSLLHEVRYNNFITEQEWGLASVAIPLLFYQLLELKCQ